MATQYGGNIKYGVQFDVDKSSLNSMKTSLQEIERLAQSSMSNVGTSRFTASKTQLDSILATTKQIDIALDSAFDISTGSVNLAKFNQNLQSSGINLRTYQQNLASIGPAGAASFRNLATEIMTTTMKIQQSNTMLDKMKNTFANTIRWSISSSILQGFTSSVQKAYSYVKELDSSLNDIMLVTDKSAGQMAEFARQANKAAKELGATTTAYTNASLIYYQQGLADAEVAARSEVTLKAANVTGQSADAVSEQLTAVWNGYKVSAQETEVYVDKLAKVAARTAADLEELSTGMSKVASAANLMGVDVDQLNAQLATIISVTREAPETIGTSLKTVYARMADIEAGLDTETTLGEYSQGMADLGFNVLDANGKIRDMGEVIEEIGGKWGTLNREQQISLTQTMAGTRQYSRLLSLFDNWDMYTDALNESASATGFLQEQQDEYMQSMEAHLTKLKAAQQGLYDSFFETESMNNLIDGLTVIIELFDSFVQSIGGGGNVILMGLLLLLNTFSDKLAITLVNTQTNMTKMNAQTANEIAQREILSQLETKNDMALQKAVELKSKVLQNSKLLSAEEIEQVDAIIQKLNQEGLYLDALEQEKRIMDDIAQRQLGLVKYKTGQANPYTQAQINEYIVEGQNRVTSMKQGIYNNAEEEDVYTSQQYMQDMDATRKEYRSRKAVIENYLNNSSNPERVAHWQKELEKLQNQYSYRQDTMTSIFKNSALRDVATHYNVDSNEYKQASDAIDHLDAQLRDFPSTSNNVKNSFVAVQKAVQNLGIEGEKSIKIFSKNAQKDYQALGEAGKRNLQDIANSADQMGFVVQKRANTQNIMNMVSAFGTLAMSVGMVTNAFSVWENESLSTGEKVLQFIQALGFALPMLYSSFMKIVNASTILTGIVKGQLTMQGMLNLAQAMGVDIQEDATFKEVKAALVKERYNQLLKEEIALHGGDSAAIDAETKARLKNQATQDIESNKMAKKGGRGQAFKDGAKNALSWVKANGKLIGSFALVAAGIAIVVAAIKIADKFYNKEKYAAEEAAEAAKNAAQVYSDTQEEYNKFKDSISQYSDATTALNDLTKGTVEYKEKVMEANEAALKLIQTIDGLNYSINAETGLIEIEEESWENAQEAQLQKLETAQAYQAFATQRSQNAQLAYKQTQYNREQLEGRGLSEEDKGAIIGYGGSAIGGAAVGVGAGFGTMALAAKIGGTVGSAITPGIGTAIGIAAGAIVGGIGALVTTLANPEGDSTDEETEALKELAKAYKEEGSSALTPSEMERILSKGDYSDDLIKSLKETDSEELQKQIEAIIANTEALEKNSQLIAGSANLNAENEYYSELTETEQGLADKIIADKRANASEEQVEEARQRAEDTFDGWDTDETYAEYLKLRFGDEASNYRVEDMAGTNATLQRKNEDGTWENVGEEDSLSNDEVIDFLTEQYLLQMTGADQANLDRIMQAGEKIDAIRGVDNDEVLAIQESLAMGDTADLSVLSPEQITALQDQMDEIGTLLGKDYAEALQKGIDNYDEALYMKHINEQYQAALSETARELEVDKDTLEMYTDSIIGNSEALAENSEIAVEVAKQSIKFAQGTEDLQEALEDNLDILKEWNKDAFETYEAAAKVQDALEKMFGVKVSANFIKEHLNEIEAAAEGDIKAIEELSLLAAQDYTASLNIDKDRLSDVNALLEQLANTEVGIGVSTEVDTSAGIQALNELLASGAITQEEMENMFSSIGYTPEVKMVKIKGKPTETIQTHTINGPGFLDYTYTDTISSQTDITVPQIAEEDVDAGDIEVGKSTSGTFTQTATSQSRAKSIGSLGDKDIKSDAQKNADKMKYLDEERDIYHDINIELEKLENNLNKVQKARESMTGGDVIDSMNEELDILNNQVEAQKIKLQIAQMESKTLKDALAQQGVTFEEGGEISNYHAILDAKEAEINALISQYKASNSTDTQDKIQEQIDAKKEEYDKLKETIERYDEVTFSEIADLESEIQELMNAKIELQIEKFSTDIELKVDLNDFKKEWRELQKEILYGEEDILSGFNNSIEGLKDLIGENGDGLFTDQIERLAFFKDEFDRTGNKQYQDAAKEMADQAMASAESIQEYIDSIKDAAESAIEEITSLHGSILNTFDQQLEVIEHEMNVKKLLTGDSTDVISELQEKLDVQIDKISANRKQVEDLQYILDSRGDTYKEEDLAKWAEDMAEITDAYQSMFTTVEEALQSINELLSQTVEKSLEAFEDNMTGGLGWDELSSRWEKDQELADIYLSSVNQEYELQKLVNKVNEDLLSTEYDRLDAQKKINDFKNEELAMLMKKDKLTQAEVDRANQLYELTLLQIALDEARNNKTSMRLTRDSQGNYVYQYTADEEKIAEAEQNLLDKENDIYNQNVQNVVDSISNFNAAGQEMQDNLSAIFDDERFQKYLGLSTSDEGRKSAEFKELEQWLNDSLDEISEDSKYKMSAYQEGALQSLNYIFKDLGMGDVDLNNLTDEQREILETEGIDIDKLNVLRDFNENDITNQMAAFERDIESAVTRYGKDVASVFAAAGMEGEIEYYDTLDLVKINTDLVRDDIEEEKNNVINTYNEINDFMQNELPKLEKWFKGFFDDDGQFETEMEGLIGTLEDQAEETRNKIKAEMDRAVNGLDSMSSNISASISRLSTSMDALSGYVSSLQDSLNDNSSGGGDNNTGSGEGGDNNAGSSGRVWQSYAEASAAGYSNIKTSEEFSRRGGTDKNLYGTYSNYLTAMYYKYALNQSVPESAYAVQVGDRVDYGSGTGSQSWNVNKAYGEKILLQNYLTGTVKEVLRADVSKIDDWSSVNVGKIGYDASTAGGVNYPFRIYKTTTTSKKALVEYGKVTNGVFIGNGQKAWIDKSKIYKYDNSGEKMIFNTGGYTGEWFNGSKDGRLAWLHQKELVLNETDTPKILDAVQIVRELTTGSIIENLETSLSNMISSLENQLIGTYIGMEQAAASMQSSNQTLDQKVQIDATFPGVKDAKEIEAALNNLVNVASQYAYENK